MYPVRVDVSIATRRFHDEFNAGARVSHGPHRCYRQPEPSTERHVRSLAGIVCLSGHMSSASERIGSQNAIMIPASMTTMTAGFSNKFLQRGIACLYAISS